MQTRALLASINDKSRLQRQDCACLLHAKEAWCSGSCLRSGVKRQERAYLMLGVLYRGPANAVSKSFISRQVGRSCSEVVEEKSQQVRQGERRAREIDAHARKWLCRYIGFVAPYRRRESATSVRVCALTEVTTSQDPRATAMILIGRTRPVPYADQGQHDSVFHP